jgi:hypothetical protein
MYKNNGLLKVFLCHGSEDKYFVRTVYDKLEKDGFNPWLDERDIFGGQDWDLEIKRAVRSSDAILVFLSNTSVSKSGYVQKEIKLALDVADEKPEGSIFIIPVKLNDCIIPDRLSRWHWIDFGKADWYDRIKQALNELQSGGDSGGKSDQSKDPGICLITFEVPKPDRYPETEEYTVFIDEEAVFQFDGNSKKRSFRRPFAVGQHRIKVQYNLYYSRTYGHPRGSLGDPSITARGITHTNTIDLRAGIYHIELASKDISNLTFWETFLRSPQKFEYLLNLRFEPYTV